MKPRLIAFYLPQYHPIPENDEWWGKDFTDWKNVAKARPLFRGHNQPHIPAELGYYDLRNPEVRQAQAELAKQYSIYGFCYHHYWFQGRRILNRPFDEVLASGKPDFPFCLNWANENWSRRWDGSKHQLLIEQKYSEEDDARHIEYLIPIFKDGRYIKLQGKPLFLIYKGHHLPDPLKTTELWRERASAAGLPGLYLCKIESNGDQSNSSQLGFDAAVQFPPHHVENNNYQRKGKVWDVLRAIGLSETAYGEHNISDYQAVAQSLISKKDPDYKFFPGIVPGWDNTPRRKRKGWILKNSSPKAYENWLKLIIQKKAKNNFTEENLIFINAWNEWAEGAYLEPDQKFGRAYLEATKRAVEGIDG